MKIKTRSIIAAGLIAGVGMLWAQDKQPSSYAPVDIHETFASTMARMSASEARGGTLLPERAASIWRATV